MKNNNENSTKEEFGLNSLRNNPKFSEETKGIEFGVNPGKVSTEYILWRLIFSVIGTIIGVLFMFFFRQS